MQGRQAVPPQICPCLSTAAIPGYQHTPDSLSARATQFYINKIDAANREHKLEDKGEPRVPESTTFIPRDLWWGGGSAWPKVNPDVTVAPGWTAKAASGTGEGRALLHRAAAWKLFLGMMFLLSSANRPIPFNLLHPQRVCDLWVTSCLNGMPASSAGYVGAAERGCASLAPWLVGGALLPWDGEPGHGAPLPSWQHCMITVSSQDGQDFS